mgnify:CR=1 FL=1
MERRNAGFHFIETGSWSSGWGTGAIDATVFIDGNNLYHNTRSMGFAPGRIDFESLVRLVCAHFGARPKSVYYYNSVPDISDGDERYYLHQKFLSGLRRIEGFEVMTRKLQKQSNAGLIADRVGEARSAGFCAQCLQLMERLCSRCIGPVTKREKGVDVAIAVDMLNTCVLKDEADMCILISGDADFIPALDIVRSRGKEVASASVHRGYSYNLRQKHRYFVLGPRELTSVLKR